MKIALASLPVLNRQPEQNIETILRAMQICSGKTDLLVFGEAALHGFDCLTWDYDTDCALALSQTDPSIRRICHAAKRFGIGVSFGYFEKAANTIYSSQIVIDASGGVLYNFRRVSVGWKDLHRADAHYREGERFGTFHYRSKCFTIGLCGDLWTDGCVEKVKKRHVDAVLWPVWCDYSPCEWNTQNKYEYAQQAALCGDHVLLVNPCCTVYDGADAATGGSAYFRSGNIAAEIPAGSPGILFVDI